MHDAKWETTDKYASIRLCINYKISTFALNRAISLALVKYMILIEEFNTFTNMLLI